MKFVPQQFVHRSMRQSVFYAFVYLLFVFSFLIHELEIKIAFGSEW